MWQYASVIAHHKVFSAIIIQCFLLFVDKTEKITISVKPAVDFPVDLYYLMDMSKSMEDDLEKLRTLGTKIGL